MTLLDVTRLAVTLLAVALLGAPADAREDSRIIYVDDDAPIDGDGTSWARPYPFLQDALADAALVADPVEIRIGPGRYYPDRSRRAPQGSGDRRDTFLLPDGVSVIGGFAGMLADHPDHRDPVTHRTVLTGDLAGDDDGLWDNAWHVVTARNVGYTTEVAGVVITGGFGMPRGGGLLCDSASPRLVDCLFRDNGAQYGAAVAMTDGSSPRFERCVFLRNEAIWRGGAVLCFLSSPIFDHCRFERNTAINGGAMDIRHSEAIVRDTTFVDCEAQSMYFDGRGGAVTLGAGSSSFVRCTFVGNVAQERGGAVHASEEDTSTFLECIIESNRANAGGGIVSDEDALPALVGSRLCLNLPDAIAGPWLDDGQNSICCGGDFDGDGTVGASDLIHLMWGWGDCDECAMDLTLDGIVDAEDLVHLLAQWGVCGSAS